jgi:hypothetical protein
MSAQKPRAVEGLQQRIDDERRPVEERYHALRTLSSMTGRPFRHHDTTFARRWIARHTGPVPRTPPADSR